MKIRVLISNRFLLTVSLLIISPPTLGEICRWIDSDGTVHFANECPEGVEGSAVTLDPEPTTEQVEAAEDRARQLQEARQSRKETQAELTPQPAGQGAADAKICIDAELAVETLKRPLPVYFDDTGVLHNNRTQHSLSYEGERRYLDETERKQELARANQLVARHCGKSGSDIARQTDELKSRITDQLCDDYEAKAERMIRSRASGSADEASELIEYCESGKNRSQ